MHTTPPSLLQRLREPSAEKAWARFIRLYSRLLFFWSRRAGLREDEAADLVQEVFLVLLRELPEFEYDRHRSFRAWLRTITLNKCRDYQRKKAQLPGQARVADLAELQAADGVLGEAEYRRHLLGEALEMLKDDFQPTTWKAFEQHGLHGRPAAEVAADLGLQAGAVYAAKFRVLARLREELSGLLD